MTLTTPATRELRLALNEIRVRDNVRDLDSEHVDNLAQSIALRGLLVPLIVRPVDDGYELVAGYHRIAACRKLALADAPVVVREHEGSSADSAAENVTRKQLTPLEEAKSVQAMFDEGYTADGAAQALGWGRAKVTARAKILELPDVGQQLVGTGEIPLSAIDNLLEIAAVSPTITQALVDAIAADTFAGSQITANPGWAIGQALRHAGANAFGAYLNQVHASDLASLRLGKKTDALVTKADQLHKQLDRYAYGPPAIRFTTDDIDQARAAGVLIEIERSAPIICDRDLYRELCKQAIARTVAELTATVAAKTTGAAGAGKRDRTPREELDVEHRAQLGVPTTSPRGTTISVSRRVASAPPEACSDADRSAER